MIIESELVAVVTPHCDRVFPDTAPVDTARPYVTYQQIGGDPLTYVDDAVPTLKNGVFQFNVWADTRLEASALLLEIESALIVHAGFGARPTSAPMWDYDPDMERFCSRQDFSIWSAR